MAPAAIDSTIRNGFLLAAFPIFLFYAILYGLFGFLVFYIRFQIIAIPLCLKFGENEVTRRIAYWVAWLIYAIWLICSSLYVGRKLAAMEKQVRSSTGDLERGGEVRTHSGPASREELGGLLDGTAGDVPQFT